MHFRKSNFCSNELDVQEAKAVSHSSTKSEVIFLDAGLRMDGITALDMWDLVFEGLHHHLHPWARRADALHS